jgi:membrane-associated phospholipid phosphatase
MIRGKQWLSRQIYKLELFEIIGILVSIVAVAIFFIYANKLDDIYGVIGYHWQVVNDVVGVFQNVLPWVFTAVLAGLLILKNLLQRRHHKFFTSLAYLVRVLITFCLMLAIYKIVNFYIAVFNPFDKDAVLQHIDRIIFFDKLPSEWLEPLISKPLTYILSGAYMSWFFMVYATILLMFRHSRKAVSEYVFTAIFTFYIGYVTYIIVPAIGPIFTVQYAHPVGGIATLFAHDQTLIARDCFPSLHTGISLVMLINVWRYQRKWTWFYAPLVTLIIFSTLYLRFHYGIDDIAGAALAVVTTQLSPLFVSAWQNKRVKGKNRLQNSKDTPVVSAHNRSELA